MSHFGAVRAHNRLLSTPNRFVELSAHQLRPVLQQCCFGVSNVFFSGAFVMVRLRKNNVGLLVLSSAVLVSWTFVAAQPKPAPNGPEKPQVKRDKQEPKNLELSHFMRVKLDALGKILEGLAVEDYELIKEGAQNLHSMSTAERVVRKAPCPVLTVRPESHEFVHP
jgi:hypothetical protein